MEALNLSYKKFFTYIPLENICVHAFAFCISSNIHPTVKVKTTASEVLLQVLMIKDAVEIIQESWGKK